MDSPDGTISPRVAQLEAVTECLRERRWRLAEVRCRMLLAADKADTEALHLLALSIAASGEAARAAPLMERVRRARPDQADPCRDLATMLPRVPRSVVARQYRACLRLAPADARLRHDFAGYLLENGEPDTALTVLRDAPEEAATFSLRGMALAETGKYKEAIRCFESVVRADREAPSGWSNLGMMLTTEGRFDEALAAYDRALEHAGDDPVIKAHRAVTLLRAGRWENAWCDHEARLGRPGHTPVSTAPLLPTPDFTVRLDGRHVLVWHDEGFGDTLQFARYLPLLAARGASVTVWVPVSLVRLLRGMAGIAVVRAGEAPPPSHDLQCPFFSLPRVFGTTVDSVPREPYLSADPALAAAWSARLPMDGLRAGLVWSGQARPWLHGFGSVDRRRNVALRAFAPLASVGGVRFVSLQAGTPAAQGQEPPAGMALMDPMEEVHDFADTAAIIANLDVVISVDTAVAHLAGAMGKPVFLLDRYDNCWRWLHGRTDSPWYQSMTIFRQPRPGDWNTVMHRAAAALGAMAIFRSVPSVPSAMRAARSLASAA